MELKNTLGSFLVLAFRPLIKTHIKGCFRGKERVLAVW